MKLRIRLENKKRAFLIALSLLASVIIVIALINRDSQSPKLTASNPIVTPNSSFSPSPVSSPSPNPSPSPSPSPISIIDPLFTAFKWEHEIALIVNEHNAQGELSSSDQVGFFSDPNAVIEFLYQYLPSYTSTELTDFEKRITVQTVNGEKDIPFNLQAFDKEAHINGFTFYFHNLPKADIKIRFQHADGQQFKEFVFVYTPSFTYNITSANDEQVNRYFNLPSFAKRVLPDQTYTYQIEFSLDVNRASVVEKLKQQMQSFDWKSIWQDDRHLSVSVNVVKADLTKTFTINMYDIQSKTGVRLRQSSSLLIKASELKTYQLYNFVSNKTTTLFQSLTQYKSFDYSTDGKWILVTEEANESYEGPAGLVVSLLDMQGKVKKHWNTNFQLIQWLPKGHSLVYIEGQKLMQYDLDTDTASDIWTLPLHKYSKKESFEGILDLSVNRKTGKIIIQSIYNDTGEMKPVGMDVYLFNDITDSHPRNKLSLYTASWKGGLCYCGFNFTDSAHFTYMDSEIVEVNGEKQWKSQIMLMDWNTLESKPFWTEDGVNYWANLADDEQIVYASQQDPTHWFAYNPHKHIKTPLLESQLFIENPKSIGHGKYLMFSTEPGWYVLDLKRKKLDLIEKLPKNIWQLATLTDKLIFLQNPEKLY